MQYMFFFVNFILFQYSGRGFTATSFCCFAPQETRRLYSTVKLSNLKELVVNVGEPKDWSFLPITNLIHASPRLERLIIEVNILVNMCFKSLYHYRESSASCKCIIFCHSLESVVQLTMNVVC